MVRARARVEDVIKEFSEARIGKGEGLVALDIAFSNPEQRRSAVMGPLEKEVVLGAIEAFMEAIPKLVSFEEGRNEGA